MENEIKAMIKKNGEILNIKSRFNKVKIDKEFWIETSKIQIKNSDKKDIYYILSDGKKYEDSEVIVGIDNIREYKLKNIIK
jgi:hypothetical protein